MTTFLFGNETDLLADYNNAPVKTAFVIVEGTKGYMLLYNKYRHVWELTGGMVEEGESPACCAIRECKEESNQDITDVRFITLAQYAGRNDHHFSAIYHAFLAKEADFIENSEIAALRWWKPGEEINDMCTASMELLELYINTK